MVSIAVHDISKLEMGELQQQKTTSGCFWWWRIQELFANLLYNPSIVYPIVSLSLSPFTYSLSLSLTVSKFMLFLRISLPSSVKLSWYYSRINPADSTNQAHKHNTTADVISLVFFLTHLIPSPSPLTLLSHSLVDALLHHLLPHLLSDVRWEVLAVTVQHSIWALYCSLQVTLTSLCINDGYVNHPQRPAPEEAQI